jgi:hypothetical protein
MATAAEKSFETLRTLPGDDVRQILWRFAGPLRPADAGAVGARGGPRSGRPAGGGRRPQHARLDAGEGRAAEGTSTNPASPASSWTRRGRLHRRAEEPGAGAGGFRAGLGGRRRRHRQPGRACLALSPIHERGTPEQRSHYMSLCAPAQPGEDRSPGAARSPSPSRSPTWASRPACWAARCASPSGRRAGAHPPGGQARPLHHQHGLRQLRHRRGGFGRPAHQGHLHGDPGGGRSGRLRPRHAHPQAGAPALLHRDPVFSLKVPASRIIGGYTVKDGVIVPNYSHGEIIEAVFRRTRVTVAS